MPFEHIAVNIITGFLGAGKTTAIRHLLSQLADDENWAIVVNEFGQVGIDAELLSDQPVAVKSIPGGCLCCVSSQAFSVGLNQIIRQQKPSRILIEPSGLGHPAQLLQTLQGEYYKGVLDLKSVICLLDAKQLADTRYTEHPSFVDQIQVADVLIGNKLDTYDEMDREAFYRLSQSLHPAPVICAMVEQGRLDINWLDQTAARHELRYPRAHSHTSIKVNESPQDLSYPWRRVDGYSRDAESAGWVIAREVLFDTTALSVWLQSLITEQSAVIRIKAILRNADGWIMIQAVGDQFEVQAHGDAAEQRLELLVSGSRLPEDLDEKLARYLEKPEP